ncbi:MAG: metallophosphoesterase [Phycisphaerales bacterium]|nr:metallophosphoesterase [Phycisphaerales bacterium]
MKPLSEGSSALTPITDAARALDVIREATELVRDDPGRRGSLLSFGSAGQVVMTGDLHGNLGNLAKLQRYCALERSPGRYVILHELIHSEPSRPQEPDLSIDLLLTALEWKCRFPDNVFFLQSNHELSQALGFEITKGGRSVLHDFERGLEMRFGRDAGRVLEAVNDYILALPLAARTASGVFMAHSLPDPLRIDAFDAGIFDRLPTAADLEPGGPGHALVWGRFHTPRDVDAFARLVSAEHLIVGHTPQEQGHTVIGRLIILASDHNHGVFLPIDLAKRYTTAQLEAAIRKFVSVE